MLLNVVRKLCLRFTAITVMVMSAILSCGVVEGGSVVLLGADSGVRVQNMVNRVNHGATLAGGSFSSFGVYNTNLANPTLSQIQSFDTALVWGTTSQSDATALGNLLADFVDGGGNVVMMMNFGFYAPGGRWASGGYDPLVSYAYTTFGQSLAPGYNTADPLFAGVSVINAEYKMLGNARANATVLASFAPGAASATPLLVETTAFNGKIRNLNFAASDYWVNTNGDIDRLIYNTLTVGMSTPPAAVPEPSSAAIYGVAMGAVWLMRRRSQRLSR